MNEINDQKTPPRPPIVRQFAPNAGVLLRASGKAITFEATRATLVFIGREQYIQFEGPYPSPGEKLEVIAKFETAVLAGWWCENPVYGPPPIPDPVKCIACGAAIERPVCPGGCFPRCQSLKPQVEKNQEPVQCCRDAKHGGFHRGNDGSQWVL